MFSDDFKSRNFLDSLPRMISRFAIKFIYIFNRLSRISNTDLASQKVKPDTSSLAESFTKKHLALSVPKREFPLAAVKPCAKNLLDQDREKNVRSAGMSTPELLWTVLSAPERVWRWITSKLFKVWKLKLKLLISSHSSSFGRQSSHPHSNF